MTPGRRALAESAAVAVVAYVVAASTETMIIRALRPSEWELAWVSDVILSVALGAAVYLYRNLLTARTALAERERAELVLQTQLSLAAQIQRQMLPAVPPRSDGLEFAAALESAGKIGGDFYDLIENGPDMWTVLIADVSGKGIPAAMALGVLRSTFRAQARQHAPPAQIATQLSSAFLQDWRGVLYATCIVITFDVPAGRIKYTNAGHPVGMLGRSDGVRHLDRGGPPLGLLPGARFEEDVLSLAAGDTCLLVTDGVTEALDDSSVLPDLLRGSATGAEELCAKVMARAHAADGPSGVTGWEDDRTVVVVRMREGSPQTRGPHAIID